LATASGGDSHSIIDLVTNEEMRLEAMEFTRRMSQGELVHSITGG